MSHSFQLKNLDYLLYVDGQSFHPELITEADAYAITANKQTNTYESTISLQTIKTHFLKLSIDQHLEMTNTNDYNEKKTEIKSRHIFKKS